MFSLSSIGGREVAYRRDGYNHPFGIVIDIVALKFAALFAHARLFKLQFDQSMLVAFSLPQIGEFAFVFLSFANQGVLDIEITSPLMVVVALSMAITPLLFIINKHFVQLRFGTCD